MSVLISDDILYASRMQETEFLRKIVLWFYQQKRLSMGKASKLVHMTRQQFQHLLASREIPVNYGAKQIKVDINILTRVRQL